MYHAIARDLPDIAEILIEEGATFTDQDKDDMSAMFVAAEYKTGQVIQLLAKHGADVNQEGSLRN